MTKIEWTEQTWNPIVGCSVVSPGCTNCYAMRMAARLAHNPQTPQYAGTIQMTRAGAVWTGKLARAPEYALLAPLRRNKPTMYFVNSMSDLFHENVPDEWIDRVFAVMALCPQHTFQVLTKRAERMREYLTFGGGDGKRDVRNRIAFNAVIHVMNRWHQRWIEEGIDGPHRSRAIAACTAWPLPNVWLGVSTEDQARSNERIPDLLATPAAVRFVSAEPLLGPIDLNKVAAPEKVEDQDWGFDALAKGDTYYQRIERELDPPIYDVGDGPYRDSALDWVIAGGESGPNARPMHPDWARSLRDQCAAADVPFFFKQWGEWAPHRPAAGGDLGGDLRADRVRHVQREREPDGHFREGDLYMRRTGKRAAGRHLYGVLHDAIPGGSLP